MAIRTQGIDGGMYDKIISYLFVRIILFATIAFMVSTLGFVALDKMTAMSLLATSVNDGFHTVAWAVTAAVSFVGYFLIIVLMCLKGAIFVRGKRPTE